MTKTIQRMIVLITLGCLLATTGCAVMTGSPSLTFLSRDINSSSPNIKVLGSKDQESDTLYWCLLFAMFGQAQPSHEASANRLLEKYNADLLLDAEMTSTVVGIPYIFMYFRMTTKGIPAVFVKGDNR